MLTPTHRTPSNGSRSTSLPRRGASVNQSVSRRARPVNLYLSSGASMISCASEDTDDIQHIGNNDESISSDEIDEESSPPLRKQARADPSETENSLQDVKHLLQVLCEKVESNEKTLKELRHSKKSSSSTSVKRSIPLIVRQEVRKTYRTLVNEDESFTGWNLSLGSSIKSSENQAVISKLTKEVKGLNPSFSGADIWDAAYRFYKSKCEQESLKRKGQTEKKKVSRRRHERIVRKRKEREATLKKNGRLTEDQRLKWLSVMKNE